MTAGVPACRRQTFADGRSLPSTGRSAKTAHAECLPFAKLLALGKEVFAERKPGSMGGQTVRRPGAHKPGGPKFI